jgi:uncharacterized protein with PQ loop repeat
VRPAESAARHRVLGPHLPDHHDAVACASGVHASAPTTSAPAHGKSTTVNLSLASAIGLAGALLAFVSTLPQAAKLMRMRSAAGVSVAALANSTISGLAWTAFGVLEHDAWVALTALVAVPATAAAAGLAWFRGGSRERLWMPCAWALTLLTAIAVSTWTGTGPLTLMLGCSISLLVAPAAATAWRSPDISAVAASAWLLMLVEALLTGAYGALAGIDANLLYAAVASLGSLAVLTRLAIPTHVHARLFPHPVVVTDLPAPYAQETFELAS